MHIESLKEQAAQLGITEVLRPGLAAPSALPPEKDEESHEEAKKRKKSRQTDRKKEIRKGAEKYRNLKQSLKEKQRMEEQLNALKQERQRKLEAFKLKMRAKKATAAGRNASLQTKSVRSEKTNSTAVSTEEDKGKPPVRKPSGGEDRPVKRLNQSEFNKASWVSKTLFFGRSSRER